jgi:tRNA A-37 threonylcarbamoyl transferase component Bud32/MFS family permease
MTDTSRTCPQCRGVLPLDAPEGLCPACLLQNGFPSEPGAANATDPATEVGTITPELERLFPDLEIFECLGQGGMGVVYKARQKQLDRLVALKVMKADTAKDPAFAERFTREARALAKLDHPNIVSVFDFGQTEGRFFLLMEHVDGTNLRQVIRTKSMAPKEALHIVPEICQALQYAHDQGVVHRDIKPENILIDKSGRVMIADFGLAKLIGPGESDYTLTQHGMSMGTPRYMAPEQMDNPQEVDHRADIYSLGVVFYELLTGEVPMGRFAPPSQKVEVDVRLDEVVLRSLAREPELRFQNVSDVKTEIESIGRSPSAAGRPDDTHTRQVEEGPKLSRLALWGVGWATISLIVAFAVFGHHTQGYPVSEWMLLLMLWAMLGVAGTTCGAAGIYEIRNAKGRIQGLPMAAFATLCFPLVALVLLLTVMVRGLGALEAIVVAGFVGWVAWGKIRGPKKQAEPRPRSRPSLHAIFGVVLAVLGILALFKTMRTGGDLPTEFVVGFDGITFRRLILSLIIGLGALSPVFGWLAIRDIRQSEGQLSGMGLAGTAMLLFPICMALVVGSLSIALIGAPAAGVWKTPLGIGGLAVGGFFAYRLVRKTRRLVDGTESAECSTGVIAYVILVTTVVTANLYWRLAEWGLLQLRDLLDS